MLSPWAMLRTARYALPGHVERIVPGPDAAAAARLSENLSRQGFATTVGYFQSSDARPEEIVAANVAIASLLSNRQGNSYLSVKAPPLAFDPDHLRTIADAAAAAGLSLTFDAHAPKDADRTLSAASDLLRIFPGTGVVLPARWRRSRADAGHFRDSSARIRIVKGEWADSEADENDIAAGYLDLAARLAGRSAPVAVATHDPELAERAITLLRAAGTPCELEQLRGLPRRRSLTVAKRHDVPVRLYVPFGPGWWGYALDKALGRPYLLSWIISDLLGTQAGGPAKPEVSSATG